MKTRCIHLNAEPLLKGKGRSLPGSLDAPPPSAAQFHRQT